MNTARGFEDYTFRELKEYLLQLEKQVTELKKEVHDQLQAFYRENEKIRKYLPKNYIFDLRPNDEIIERSNCGKRRKERRA